MANPYEDGNIHNLILTSVYLNGVSGTNKTINWRNGNVQKVSMTDDCTFTFTNPVSGICSVLFVNSGEFVYSATWPENIIWKNNTAPSFTANRTVIIEFYYDGSNYYGRWEEYY